MTRNEIETVAAAMGVKVDGIRDDLMAARAVLTRVPGVDPNGEPAYVRAALELLARGVGVRRADGAEEKARTVEEHHAAAAWHRSEAKRLLAEGRLTYEEAHRVAAEEHERAAAVGGEERDPVGSAAARNASLKVKTLTRRTHDRKVDASSPIEELRAASEVAQRRFREDAEGAYRTLGTDAVVQIDGEDAGEAPDRADDSAQPDSKRARARMAAEMEGAWRQPLRARVTR